jgi:hypothetical protein
VDELRAGRERSELEEREREEARGLRLAAQETVTESGPNLDDELEQLFQEAVDEESASQEPIAHVRGAARAPVGPNIALNRADSNIHAQSMTPAASRNPEYRARRVAGLHRELRRMRNNIERVIAGLREFGQTVPDHINATNRLSELVQTLDVIYNRPVQQAEALENQIAAATATTQADRTFATLRSRADQARRQMEEARRSRDALVTELSGAEDELSSALTRHRQLQAEQRTAENYMRLFGTREEMVAQGDNYESPIGGMFDRADERFRQAEEVRREERVLRRVLEDQDARGEYDDEALYRLVELESRQRDVWGVPITQPGLPLSGPGDSVSSGQQQQDEVPVENDQDEPEASHEESALEEYYTLLRRQNWSQQSRPTENNTSAHTFATPQNITSTTYPQTIVEQNPNITRRGNVAPAAPTFVGGPPGHQLDPDPIADNDRGLDAAFILAALSSNNDLGDLTSPNSSPQDISAIRNRLEMNALTSEDGQYIETLLENETLLWRCQLPAERNRRRRARQEQITFIPEILELTTGARQSLYHIEIMAECFQMSARVRQESGLNGPDNLRMLYRLQRGLREDEDRVVLVRMLENNETLNLAMELHNQQTRGAQPPSGTEPADIRARIDLMRRRLLDGQRILAARVGDHSRAELNSQRLAAEANAVATGVLTLPRALLERIASSSAENRAAWERLQAIQGAEPLGEINTFMIRRQSILNDLDNPDSDNSEAGENDQPRGLDAPDSGRPDEPLSDEAMTVKLDCRICYAQISSIACLPCGHLSMCEWCSDQHSPTMPHDRTRPRRSAACPVCRKGVRQKVKIFRA